jgi:hypothetical protein
MTPLLLTLASLTPGDGGPSTGAARAAVVPPLPRLDIEWVGERLVDGAPPLQVSLNKNGLAASCSTLPIHGQITFRPDGTATTPWFGRNLYKMTYTLNGNRLTIRDGTHVYVLRPAAPRKKVVPAPARPAPAPKPADLTERLKPPRRDDEPGAAPRP